MTADAQLRRGSLALLVSASLLLAACSVAIAPSPPGLTLAPASATASPSVAAASLTASPPTPTATPEAVPIWVADLAGQLRCDGPVADLGQEVPAQPGPFDPGATPDKALDNIRVPYQSIPKTGFEPTEVEGHWARFRYLVGDDPKLVAVATDRFAGITEDVGWEVVGIRACDVSEFAPRDMPVAGATVWSDRFGGRVNTTVVMSVAGPEGCGWESTVFLYLHRDEQFFRDPRGALADESIGRFKANTKLPEDATDTGYHTKKWRLYTVPAGDAVYVKTATGTIERWPRARFGVGCA